MTRKVGGDTSNFLPKSVNTKTGNASGLSQNMKNTSIKEGIPGLNEPSSFVTTVNNTVNKASNAAKSLTNTTTNVAKSITNTAANATNTVATATDTMVNNAMKVVNNAKNSISNTVIPFAKENVFAPIQESINGSFESETSPYVSIPIMIGIGLLIIVLILLVIFRDQVSYGLEVAWQKLKALFSSSDSPAPPPPVKEKHHARISSTMSPTIDKAAIGNMLPGQREVFNIADNKYKYSDAEPLCKAFGAELATYDQVKEAWKKGADWCNYGWVKGQSAVYPTQQSTYDKLQAGPEDQRMACGTPGVNGGYFDNPELRFGVNCYGARPAQTDTDFRHLMQQEGNRTQGALEYDKKVQDFKVHRDQIPVNPFHS